MKEILLIGNGPSAAKYEMGKAIDNFPLVVRFNTYRIEGYEKYVGTKCDIWFACDLFPAWQNKYDYKEVYVVNPVFDGPNKLWDAFLEKRPDAIRLPQWVWRDVSAEMGAHPSSGALAAYFFSKSYDRVYLYGFDCFQADRHHYGDELAHCHHKADRERAFINRLKDGVVCEFNNYTVLHNTSDSYGAGGGYYSPDILELKPASVLDYGCGKGGLVRRLRQLGVKAEGYDPYVFQWQKRPEGEFDVVVTTDLLEHLDDELDTVLSDIASYRPRVILHAVSNRTAHQTLPDGTNAHKTVESPDWWLDRLSLDGYRVFLKRRNKVQNCSVFILERDDKWQ